MNKDNNKKQIPSEIREKIFSAAQKLFVQKGYHNTSMPDIVKEAGVSTGAIYHYFSGKEDLAKYIHQRALDEFFRRFGSKVRSEVHVKEKIYGYIDLMFEWTESDPIMVQYLLYARPKEILDICVSICAKEGLDAVIEIVECGRKSGDIRCENNFIVGANISGTIARLIQMRLDGLLTTPLTEISRETAETIWFGISK